MAQHIIHLFPNTRPTTPVRAQTVDFPRYGPVSGLLYRVVHVIAQWEHRRRTRLDLKDLDEHMLKDIGLTHQMAETEAQKPFYIP